ncbi:LytTR family transcriptional regulator DNA-binding domain-containing protein, partial [Solibacillus silvestris]|uniref:LytTR family transcriptional regulator DNA-binding domain-containing protein n=1 Tax=Solibacillus silvestris TaxID=76853 RepID=UPI003F7F3B66
MELQNIETEKSFLNQYKIILEDWLPNGASIAIAVNNVFVYFHSGDQHLTLNVGSAVPENSIANKVLQTKQKIDAVMENTMFETPYYALGYPITVNGQHGALVIVLPPLFKVHNIDNYQFLTGKQHEDWMPIPIDQISHIESLQKRTWFYSEGEQYKTAITLKELQLRLPNTFIRIHRSYIINIYYIKKISRDFASNF